ncbi:PorV/PorQ family protein [candidate division KSB1 bacterium]|nr:PorV/PorQ family protein [candidate division KSB1 bacterium]
MRSKYTIFKYIIGLALGAALIGGSAGFAAENGGGNGGLQDPFSVGGIGARALSLGNASAAKPIDATAVYWNPAGMEYVEKKNLVAFYTNYLAGSSMNYVGYVHPTINIGTIGVAWMLIDAGGDIIERDETGVEYGNINANSSQFMVSYGKTLPYNISLGTSLKLVQQKIGSFNGSGVGFDFGFMYRPNFDNVFLNELSVGINLQNLLAPRLKLGNVTDVWPTNFKMGIAKPLMMSEWGSQFTIYMEMDQPDGADFKFHTGTEYVFQNNYMLRVGLNSGMPSFGAGLNYQYNPIQLQLDYSYGKLFDQPLDASHRICVTIAFGKDKQELIRIAEENKIRAIQEETQARIAFVRKEKINASMEAGRRYMEEGDWIRARHEFSIVLSYENEIPNDIDIQQARDLLKSVNESYEEEQKKLLAESAAKNAREKAEHEKRLFINEQHKKALSFYEHEEYEQAIAEWNKILDRYPDNTIASEFIKKAEVDNRKQIYKLITLADDLGRRRQYLQAIEKLNEAYELNPDTKIRAEINTRKNKYGNQMNFWDLYKQGLNYELQKDYSRSEEAYERALKIDPNNVEVKKHFDYVQKRARKTKEPLKAEVKTEYLRSMRLISAGQYQQALEVLEEIEKIQPYSSDILDAIDLAREKIEQQ